MDLVDLGSLVIWIFDNEIKKLSEINDFFVGIFEGLKYIYDKGIIYWDLKLVNILIKKLEKGKFILLLIDLLINIGS